MNSRLSSTLKSTVEIVLALAILVTAASTLGLLFGFLGIESLELRQDRDRRELKTLLEEHRREQEKALKEFWKKENERIQKEQAEREERIRQQNDALKDFLKKLEMKKAPQ